MRDHDLVTLDLEVAGQIAKGLKKTEIPRESETRDSLFKWTASLDNLANAYLAIVAICHQTSPLGERQLQGTVNGSLLGGWDYLKTKFLYRATTNVELTEFATWQSINPSQLSSIFEDADLGLTLNRINERTSLLNNLGDYFVSLNVQYVRQVFENCHHLLDGDNGFLQVLAKIAAYSDPLKKKNPIFIFL